MSIKRFLIFKLIKQKAVASEGFRFLFLQGGGRKNLGGGMIMSLHVIPLGRQGFMT